MIRLASFLILIGLPLAAQSPSEPLRLGPVTIQGSIRTRVEGWRWFEGQGNADYAFSGTFLRTSFSHQANRLDWLLELEVPILLGLPANAVGPGAQGQLGLGATYVAANQGRQNAAMLFPQQGYVRFKKLFGNSLDSFASGPLSVCGRGRGCAEGRDAGDGEECKDQSAPDRHLHIHSRPAWILWRALPARHAET